MKNQCPTCTNLKDVRAEQCKICRHKYNHPRKGTGAPFRVSKSGYIMIMVNNIECYQHRVVMEQYLGRPLEKNEYVHHCDGDKTNNDIENLDIISPSNHSCHHMSFEKAKQMSIKGHKKRWNYVSDV